MFGVTEPTVLFIEHNNIKRLYQKKYMIENKRGEIKCRFGNTEQNKNLTSQIEPSAEDSFHICGTTGRIRTDTP